MPEPREPEIRDEALWRFVTQIQKSRFFGITEVTREVYDSIRDERRVFCYSMVAAGFSFFLMENWHFDGGDLQHPTWPGAGSTCHSLNLDPPHVDNNGKVIAIWGNAFAQAEAERIIAEMAQHSERVNRVLGGKGFIG